MRIPRIYTGQELKSHATLELEPGPSQHVARAMRMRPGDALTVFNGRGGEYPAKISAVGRKSVTLELDEISDMDVESPLAIHLGIAISRGDRMDWVIQKATELGVRSVSPLFTDRTEVKLKGDRADKKERHWQQVAISACEQCGRNQIPLINAPQLLAHWLDKTETDLKLVLHHRAPVVGDRDRPPASIALLIGPEGGLSNAEIALSENAGYQSLKLGPRVMRTETAPLAAIAILQARWGDISLDL